jgi:hypothetical protein
MRSLLAFLAAALLGAGVSACGGSSADTRSTATIPPAPLETKVDGDKDNDVGAAYDETINEGIFEFDKTSPSPSDTQAITALIKRYYALGAAEDGTAACAMLYPTLAEIVPEDYGKGAGPPYMRGTSCPEVLTLMFKHFHAQLVAEAPKLQVRRIGLNGHHGAVLLNFGRALSERETLVFHQGNTWKMDSLLDGELP